MKCILKFFRRKPKFLPVLEEVGPELYRRYGSICYPGQIDKTLEDLGIEKELSAYAYALYLREEEYEALKAESEKAFLRIESEIGNYLATRPTALGNGNFHESGIAIENGGGSATHH